MITDKIKFIRPISYSFFCSNMAKNAGNPPTSTRIAQRCPSELVSILHRSAIPQYRTPIQNKTITQSTSPQVGNHGHTGKDSDHETTKGQPNKWWLDGWGAIRPWRPGPMMRNIVSENFNARRFFVLSNETSGESWIDDFSKIHLHNKITARWNYKKQITHPHGMFNPGRIPVRWQSCGTTIGIITWCMLALHMHWNVGYGLQWLPAVSNAVISASTNCEIQTICAKTCKQAVHQTHKNTVMLQK